MKRARIIFFSDTHLGFAHSRKPGTLNSTLKNHRGDDFRRSFETVIDYAVSTRADLLIHGGDMFNRSNPPEAVVNRAYDKLLEAADSLPILLLAGNHERSRLPPSIFLKHRNIYIFDKPRTFQFCFHGKSYVFGGFPFQRNIRTNFVSCVEQSGILNRSADYRYLCIHQTVEGATVGPTGFTFGSGDDVIPASRIPAGLTAVLSGHIHQQQILDTRTPVVYCGSAERTSFAEIDETKYFCEMSPVDARMDFITLNATPMVNLSIPTGLTGAQVQDLIEGWSETRQHRMVVRVRFEEFPGVEVSRRVSKKNLCQIFPNACAIEVSVKGGWPISNQYRQDEAAVQFPKTNSPVQLQMF